MAERARYFLRVSTGGQDEASQLPDVSAWCDSHGYKHDAGEAYVVHGASAYKGRHAGALDRALDDMAAGAYTVLVVWAADRIERRGALAMLTLAKRARDAGGRIEYVRDGHLNATNDMSDVMLALAGSVAQKESAIKSERIKAKHAALRAAGSLVGRPPWGYRTETRGGRRALVPTAQGRRWVPRIYARIVAGQTPRQVAAWLDREGVPTVKGGPWNQEFLARLVRNPVYMGQRRNNGALDTEALVSPSTFAAAGAMLRSRVRRGRGTVKHEPALLAPVCGACYGQPRAGCPDGRSPMYRVFAGVSGHRAAYYRCAGHGPQRKGCGAPMIPCGELDERVTGAMLADERPHVERVFVAGDDNADAIAALRERGADAMRGGDYTAATAAMQAAGELERQPSKPAHWEERETSETEGAYFAMLDMDGQRAYLSRHEIVTTRQRFTCVARELLAA